ncbi:hypothetical protein BV98_002208 [Sphingobium herbicidovorans NBRC 16415]|uniref:Uncharacterized protein n=1 Tax=Sphingobium herbicidovorans (strain ATCC 700291 / DSM 11019 / CCUG 56400 / KCTC 2939 / LMG 18315 / NBRC 16415 / MH) TaxID=1219045 RepID=A0A086P9G7_SPHHM|nr:hypothetical protein [Sphingobium herbicidovorans]KFG90035.1 hypothetical protein BV98_002208 [Sphingobium herbicidovorans NBRC 16415]
MPIAAEWAQRYAAFSIKRILRDADAAFGDLAQADEVRTATLAALENEAGSSIETISGRAAQDANREFRHAEDRYWTCFSEPVQSAARLVVLTPAPDVEALKIKLQLIREFELDLDKDMPRAPMEILVEDGERLGGENMEAAADDPRHLVAIDQAAAHVLHAERLAETVAELIDPTRQRPPGQKPDFERAMVLINLQQDELGRAMQAIGERP